MQGSAQHHTGVVVVIRFDVLVVRASLGPRLVLSVLAIAAATTTARAQQSDVSFGPFVSYLPSISGSPLAGLALTIATGPLALRGSGHLSLESMDASTG